MTTKLTETAYTAYGESFDCLAKSNYHKWVEIFYSLARILASSQAISRLPKIIRLPLGLWIVPKTVKSEAKMLEELNTVRNSMHDLDSIRGMERVTSATGEGKIPA